MEIDSETQKWIAKVMAGHGLNERAGL
jgi:hypothetical protein